MAELDREKMRRLRGGRTYEAMAELAGLSKSQWYEIESGKNPDVRVSTLGKIAKALGVPPGDLLKG